MANGSKSEKVKNWLMEYLREFKEYTGTIEELAKLAGASAYLIKKVLNELEEEGFLTADTRRGKGLVIRLTLPEEEEGTMKSSEQPVEKKQKKQA